MHSAKILLLIVMLGLALCAGCGGNLVFQQSQPTYDTYYDYGVAGGVYGADSYYTSEGERQTSEAQDRLEQDFLLLNSPNFEYREAGGRTKLEVTRTLNRMLHTVRVQGEYSYREYHQPMTAGWNHLDYITKPWTSVGAGIAESSRGEALRLVSLEGSLGYVTYVVDGLNGDERLLTIEVDGEEDFRLGQNSGLYIGFASWGSKFSWYGPIPARERFSASFAREFDRRGSLIGEGLLAVAVFNGDNFDLQALRVELEADEPERTGQLFPDGLGLDDSDASAENFSRDKLPEPARGLPQAGAGDALLLRADQDSALVYGVESTWPRR